jgi:hypothetical protein
MSKDVNVTMGGSVGTEIHVKEIAGLDDIKTTSTLGGIPNQPLELKSTSSLGGIPDEPLLLNSTSLMGGVPEKPLKVDLGLDNIRINALAPIVFGMKPTRIHFPLHLRFGLCALGMELMAFSICGESMIVIEDYTPNRAERCG